MAVESREEVRNLAIIAHVDHGKTTLVDAMLSHAENSSVDGGASPGYLSPDREKRVNVMAKQVSVLYRGHRINILDTPSHANFGGEVDRTLRMVEGFLLLVDACEGPLPRTRFVIRRALEEGLVPIVLITKADLPAARPAAVLEEIRALFADLEASEGQLAFPVLYCNALLGSCRRDPEGKDEPLGPLFEEIFRAVPAPEHDPEMPLQFLVTDLDYDDFLGRLALGRVFSGTIRKGREVVRCRPEGAAVRAVPGGIYRIEGLRRAEVESAGPGEIVGVMGIESVAIGDTLSDPGDPRPLPPVRADEPVLEVTVSVNDSPTAGLDGQRVSRSDLRERLWKEILTNVSVKVQETDAPDVFRILARGELHLVILFEMVRREGYEMLVGKPRALLREIDGQVHEPVEVLVVDCPEEYSTVVGQKVGDRNGRLGRMVNHGTGRVRMEFRVPSRGLIGFRTEFLRDTRGSGIMNHLFEGYEPDQGAVAARSTGVLVADRPGRATAYALEHMQFRGTLFVAPGDEVFEGMIVGENSGAEDVSVNVTKERRSSPENPPVGAAAVRLLPPRLMSLEQTLEFLREDEVVEITPRSLRLRKRVLQPGRRAS